MVYVIAEIGINHNGSMEIAERLILGAKEAGADCVKFQTYIAEKLEPPGPLLDWLKKCQLTMMQHKMLKRVCESMEIDFMSTPYDVGSLNFLLKLGLKTIKISSGGMRDVDLLQSASKAEHVILSTGMATLDQVRKALKILSTRVTLLHCVSAYPVPMDEANLLAIVTLKKLQVPVGLSDHTSEILAPIVAVGLGAEIIEKHLTFDTKTLGPDHAASLDPLTFGKMVIYVRMAEKLLGDGKKKRQPSEKKTFRMIQKREML